MVLLAISSLTNRTSLVVPVYHACCHLLGAQKASATPAFTCPVPRDTLPQTGRCCVPILCSGTLQSETPHCGEREVPGGKSCQDGFPLPQPRRGTAAPLHSLQVCMSSPWSGWGRPPRDWKTVMNHQHGTAWHWFLAGQGPLLQTGWLPLSSRRPGYTFLLPTPQCSATEQLWGPIEIGDTLAHGSCLPLPSSRGPQPLLLPHLYTACQRNPHWLCCSRTFPSR